MMTVIFDDEGKTYIARGDWNGAAFINGQVREVRKDGTEGGVVDSEKLWRLATDSVLDISEQ